MKCCMSSNLDTCRRSRKPGPVERLIQTDLHFTCRLIPREYLLRFLPASIGKSKFVRMLDNMVQPYHATLNSFAGLCEAREADCEVSRMTR